MAKNNLVNSKKVIEFLRQAGKMKNTLRFSQAKNMPKDTPAAHSWRTALMVLTLGNGLKIDIAKALEIAILHDIVEAITGNIDYVLIAQGKVSPAKKRLSEARAIRKLKNSLPPDIGKKIYNQWNAYENKTTKEAKFVHALNRLESLFHLIEVGYRYYDEPELIPNCVDKAIKDFPQLKDVLIITSQSVF